MPASAYYTTYTTEAMPEAYTNAHIASLLERMTYSELPGFVVRSAGQHPAQALMRVREAAESSHFAMGSLTIYSGHRMNASPTAPEPSSPRLADRYYPHYGPPTLQGLYVNAGSLAVEAFQPGPEVEAAFCLGFPVSLPDKEQYALRRKLVNPAWLRSDGVVATTLYPHDLGIYRRGNTITTAYPVAHKLSAVLPPAATRHPLPSRAA